LGEFVGWINLKVRNYNTHSKLIKCYVFSIKKKEKKREKKKKNSNECVLLKQSQVKG